MIRLRSRFSEFLRRPYGVGAPLNVYMFAPARLARHATTAVTNPRYFIDRIRVMVDQLRHPAEPWLTRDALRAIKAYLKSDMRAFEFGSGKSTLWLGARVAELVSVEHDAAWHARVEVMLAEAGLHNTRLRLADSARYAEQISSFPDQHFHFVLVDGADRNGCIRAAASKVARGGWLVVDNADAHWDYSPVSNYERRVTHNGVWQTDIFVKVE